MNSGAYGTNGVPNTAVARDRNGRPIQGTATARPPYLYPAPPIYGYPGYGYPGYGYGYWYPYYGPGFGYGYGYGYYDPWWYGSFGFYGAYPYGGGGGYGGYSGDYRSIATGSIRLRVSPDSAKVYIDGTLMGAASDFSGLTHHLEVPAGQHQLELRADGYETYQGTVDVDAGRTMTERVTLNKKK